MALKSTESGGVPLSQLGIIPAGYEQTLWKHYGSRENWEEVLQMGRDLARQERQIAELREQVAALEEQNGILLREWIKRASDEVN